MPHLAFVTYSEDSDHGGERAQLVPILADLDVQVTPCVWDDPAVNWASYDGALIRSTWDYFTKIDRFQTWIDEVASITRLANPAPVVHWNADKRYLPDLGRVGVPSIETVLIAPGEPADLPRWDDTVVKPSVSGGARLSGRFGPEHHAEARRLVTAIHAEGKTAMLQPYASGVDTQGEANVLMFGGVASHAVTKGGILAPGFEPEADDRLYLQQSITPLPLDNELIAFADEVLVAVVQITGVAATDLLHARVDSAVDSAGVRRLMEVELIEPFLYLQEAPDPTAAATRYAEAIAAWLDRG